ncbi:MAG TPA: glycosyltransferase, partial [Candidatus Thermoplasmatota archaeon]|nr:glycosyltransferase [Candidatus Thermoplasmatota archaeon]
SRSAPSGHVRKKHGIDGRIVLFLGSLKATHRGKGLPVLMEAVRILRDEGREDVRLVVAADGEMEAEYMALAQRLGIRDVVIHAKGVPRDEVALYFAGADVFALPSTWLEAFGLVLAEAMACGTPVVGSRIGGIPYVIGEAGQLVAPGDAPALARALAAVLDDPELARELGKRGRARVEEMFRWDNTARIAHEAYERALARRGA